MKKLNVLTWAVLAAIGFCVAMPVECHGQVQGSVSACHAGPGAIAVVVTRHIQVQEPGRPRYWRDEPADGCIISLLDAQGQVLGSLQADANGAGFFTGVPIGRYSLRYFDVRGGGRSETSRGIRITRLHLTSNVRKRISYSH